MPSGPSIWLVMLALLGTHLAGMGTFLTLPVLAPAIAAELELPASLAGVHTALAYAGALVSGPFAQGLLRRHGGIRVCQAALVVIAAGIALAVLGHPLALIASAVLAGAGHGPLTPAGSHVLAARTPPQIRSLIFGLKQTGVPAGAMLVSVIAPVVGSLYGWRAGVLAIALFTLLLALALQPLRAVLDADRDPKAPSRAAFGEALGSLRLLREHAPLRATSLYGCGLVVGQFGFFSFFVVWQVQALGMGLVEAGMTLAIGQGAGILGRILWAVLADRSGARPVLSVIGIGACLSALLLALAGPGLPWLGVVALAAAMGCFAVGWTGVLLAEVARLAPPGRVGGATSAMGFAMALTLILSPSLLSALAGLTGGYAAGFALCGALAGAAVLILRRGTVPTLAVSRARSRVTS
ncbi:MFS transporter [Siccirubricoccus phaeus]|uniref:MFS transporter n=1 Tax=Siccirubricoccus phaeus TaxID=2595053 RepID=UPI00165CBAB9|nr:MFS transporter [Siccirubricoccus phaeus]